MESLIFYKKKSPYYTESSYTETIKVDTTNEIIDYIIGKITTNTIYVGSAQTPVTITSQDNLITYASGYSAYTVSKTEYAYEDVTKNCKLTMEDLDKNFLTLKDYDISGGTFDESNHKLTLIRNNGDLVDIGVINPYSGSSGSCECKDIQLSGSIDTDGDLILTYQSPTGLKVVTIKGLTIIIKPSGDTTNYISTETPNIDKTSSYKNVLAILDKLPKIAHNGDRYIIKQQVSSFGRLYNKSGMINIQDELIKHNLIWHVPTEAEWEELITYVDPCQDTIYASGDTEPRTGSTTGSSVYIGNTYSGRALKSDLYWNGEDVYDFVGVPTDDNEDDTRICNFWSTTQSDDDYYLMQLTDDDDATFNTSNDSKYNSIRLVAYYDREIDGISTNILGTDYKVVKIGRQYWLQGNLNYANDGSKGIDYSDRYSGTTNEKLFIAYFENNMWEEKQLIEGDDVWVNTDDGMQEYYVAKTKEGKYILMPLITMSPNEDNEIISKYDSGWY